MWPTVIVCLQGQQVSRQLGACLGIGDVNAESSLTAKHAQRVE